ncbi:uncharacterized protein BX664DRAFT_335564 [Halteromyces radiatus]|uniref:uncharacterized protein n=1 Tax=Halteromyces radiatus TaxID=101107 RepID=UPI002220CAF6|nr:uncharacterized protein BX664DRAFT_335564 [Halteromyces radiatus]KAI8086342.1 hypothetical protein BX664DRAFT_335564 [Halteromyces radiatus]
MLFYKHTANIIYRSRFLRNQQWPLQQSIIRNYTSSFSNGKGHNSTNQTRSSNTEDEEKITKDSQEPFVAKQSNELNLSFMPVINIPQTEFAHNAFFSLHRPLLGLADEEEKPFFSNQPHEDEDVDEQIANYMTDLRPFEPPSAPGTTQDNEKHDRNYTTISFSTGDADQEFYMEQTLPMYYMPESDDIVEYLSTMQERLVRQNALDDPNNTNTMGRTRRRRTDVLTDLGLKANSTLFTPVSRWQKRYQRGPYRHRWNKKNGPTW